MFKCRRVVFIGDSVMRYMASHFIDLVDSSGPWGGHFDRHHVTANDTHVDFLWRPNVRCWKLCKFACFLVALCCSELLLHLLLGVHAGCFSMSHYRSCFWPAMSAHIAHRKNHPQ